MTSFENPAPDRVVDLVRRARSGSTEAFGELVSTHWLQLVAVARGVLGADPDAEDVVQDAFVHAWKRLWTLRSPHRFASWMRRIVVRRCLTRARRRKPMTAGAEKVAEPRRSSMAAEDVARLLSELAPRQRAAVYLTWIMGYTDREVGAILGIRPATVRVHRHRGIERLKRIAIGGDNE